MSGKLTTLFAAQDMTQGSPAGNLIRFSVPLLIGNLAQQLYSTVDSIVVGAYVGDGALAAVGASGPILNLLLVLFMGISVGASVMVSRAPKYWDTMTLAPTEMPMNSTKSKLRMGPLAPTAARAPSPT